MRSLRNALAFFFAAAIACLPPVALAQTNYTTNIVLSHLLTSQGLSTEGPAPYATVCATPADAYGNPISVSAPTWGLISKYTSFCGSVVSGAISGGFNVPDAAHTYASSPIFYNFTIQVTNSTGTPIGPATTLTAVPNVTTATYDLDNYAPTVSSTVTPSGALTNGPSVPSSCTAPSLFVNSTTGAIYPCVAGVYVLAAGTGGSATAIDGVTVTGTPTTGQVPTATSSTAATWQTPTAANATAVDGVTITGTPSAGQVPTATSSTAAVWSTPSGGGSANAVPAFPSGSFRTLLFGDSVCIGVYDTPSTLNYCNVWSSTYLPTATATNFAVSGASVQNLATQVYAQTFLPTDYSLIGSYSNDSMPSVGYANNYFYGYESLVAYAAIPDGNATGGWPSKVKGSALGCTGGVTTDQYSIGEKLPTAGNSCSFTFSGDVFYLGTSATNTSGQVLSVAIDGGTAVSYGPFGQGGTGQGPWIIAYNDHLGSLNYNNFLIRVPLAPGRSATHTAVITCATAPCYVDYVASNGFTNGPKVLVPLGWVNGNQGNVTGDTHNAQSSAFKLNYMCDQLSRDGLAVGCADLSGYVNYYLNSSAWANSLHPNNAGSAAQAAGLGFRSQQGIVPTNAPRQTHQWALSITGCNGFNTCSYSNPLLLTHPIKLESITMTLNGTLGSCTAGGTFTPPNLQLANQAYSRETYSFAAANLGANNFFTNLYPDTLTAWNNYVYPGITSGSCSSGSPNGGSFTIDAIITYSDQ